MVRKRLRHLAVVVEHQVTLQLKFNTTMRVHLVALQVLQLTAQH